MLDHPLDFPRLAGIGPLLAGMACFLDDSASDAAGFEVVGHSSLEAEDGLDTASSIDFDKASIPGSDREGEWHFVDAEEETSIPMSQAEELERLQEPEEPEGLQETEDLECAAEAPEAQAAQEAVQPSNVPAAELFAGAPLYLGSHLLAECEGFRGDITKHWAAALEGFPRVTSAFCLGRILVLRGDCNSGATAVAHAVVINNGSAAWPTGTALRIVAGDAYGFGAMHVGPLAPGQGADLVLDVVLPADAEPGCGKRSAWVLTDDYGEPFGPLLALEVIWA